MATRPETAKKILLYWMDATVALMGFMLSMMVLASAREGRIFVPHAVAAEVCVLAALAVLPLVLRDAYDDRPRPTAKLVAGGLFAAGAVALVPPSITTAGSWEMVGCLWLSALALYLPLRATACVGAALVALTTFYVSAVSDQPWQYLLISLTVSAVLLPATMRLWRWLWWTIREAYDSREAKATLAVSNERLRFARDLHDLLGHSLSVLTLKSELAAKLATIDTGKAAAEMADVRRLAAESLAEVQVAVDGYRVLDLDEELAGVRAALEAAGARCVIEARTDDLSPAARTLLAWAVREGATNVLKHSTATRCAIVIDGGVLEMRNDGVPGPATSWATGAGSGLRGLAERMGAAGGSFTAATTPAGEFLLRAAVPA
ncbi:sensor histidine kinase [Nonomuraea sp. NPDC050022]|uniref:sensor histidine kinase n=1 Tax=unclassified Nonomuraea TaxID=2593643 RepID=UPI0033C907EB